MIESQRTISGPDKDIIIKEILDVMIKKYPNKDIEFLKTIVNYDINVYDEEKGLNGSYIDYIMFVKKDLIKIINDSILLTEES